jgi:hypothetical protein
MGPNLVQIGVPGSGSGVPGSGGGVWIWGSQNRPFFDPFLGGILGHVSVHVPNIGLS